MPQLLKRTLLAATALVACSGAAQAGAITVYSALEEDEIAAYLAAAKTSLPGVEVNVLRLSTGDLGARLIAEAANPQADAVWGFAVTNIMHPEILKQLEPYAAKGADKLPAQFKAKDDAWFAATGYVGAFCVNTETLKAKKLPMPTSWKDLANPVYKGEVVMPNPASSGTGYLQVAAILQGAGTEEGWKLLKAIDPNMAQYTTSGSKPCKMARAGEFAIGASLAFVAMQSVEQGYPVKMVIPSDYAGYELEASGLMKGAKNKADAKAFLDWTLSAEAGKLYASFKEMTTLPGAPQSEMAKKAGLPADLSKALYPMDFAKSAVERDGILKTWQAGIGR